jgi:hypothetical protein
MKQTKTNRKISARREFYTNLEKIRDLYNNKGFKFAKELYEYLNFNMSLWSFNHYFNKEIKNKYLSQAEQDKDISTKKAEQDKDINTKTKENYANSKPAILQEFSDEAYARYKQMSDAIDAKYGDYIKNQKIIFDTEE